jgi:Arc/MetJ family transcription regulator
MRTTIRLDDELLAEAKRYASQSGRTLTGLIEDALREVLARRSQSRPRERVTLTRYGRGGTQPGVDLDNSAALMDVMDSDA